MGKISRDDIEKLLDAATVDEHVFHGGKCLVLSYLLPNGFTVEGRAGLGDASKFNRKTGEEIAREDALRKLWMLEVYATADREYRRKISDDGVRSWDTHRLPQ